MTDYPDLPDFLNRKLNPIAEDRKASELRRAMRGGIIWTKKRNWRKIEARRREREKREGTAIAKITNRRGQ